MDKSGYTDMTSIQILVFFALVIIIAVFAVLCGVGITSPLPYPNKGCILSENPTKAL
jgi:hypothetical protein